MSDADGALTPEDYEKLKAWFATRWKGQVSCPICGTHEWAYGTHVVKMPRHANDGYTPGTMVFPYVPVHCKSCAHTLFFGAAIIGVAANSLVQPSTTPAMDLVNRLLSAPTKTGG